MNELYPEIGRFGSLAKLLRKSLSAPGLSIRGFDEIMNGSRYWASVKDSQRSSDVSVALEERAFSAPLWHLGVRLASIDTALVDSLIRVLRAWFVDQVSATELPGISGRVSVSGLAADYEAGPAQYVEAVWQAFLGSSHSRADEVIRASSAQPRLRSLLPFTSMTTLCFSRTTGFPFLADTPRIETGLETFVVISTAGERTAVASAVEAAELAAALLPTDITAAIHGRAA